MAQYAKVNFRLPKIAYTDNVLNAKIQIIYQNKLRQDQTSLIASTGTLPQDSYQAPERRTQSKMQFLATRRSSGLYLKPLRKHRLLAENNCDIITQKWCSASLLLT